MPQIIPIRDLKNTSEISRMCQAFDEPIFITKNGYEDMVIMSMKLYEEKMFMLDVYSKLIAAEEQITEGKILDGEASLKEIREKIGKSRAPESMLRLRENPVAAEEGRLNGRPSHSIDEVSDMMKAAVQEVLDGQRK